MADRTINFGSDSTEATYQIQDDDPAGGGDFVIRDTDANLAILSYDQTNDEWDFAATANFNSNDITDITSLTADTINVDTLDGADIANATADDVLETDGSGGLRLQAGEVTVNGNTISLGGSVTLAAADVDAVGDGDDVGRDIYVISAGASDPASADNNDLIFEQE